MSLSILIYKMGLLSMNHIILKSLTSVIFGLSCGSSLLRIRLYILYFLDLWNEVKTEGQE